MEGLCPNTEPVLCPKRLPPAVAVLLDGCPKEKVLALLVFAELPNSPPPLLPAAAVEAGVWPKIGCDPNPDGLKEKLLAEPGDAFQKDSV